MPRNNDTEEVRGLLEKAARLEIENRQNRQQPIWETLGDREGLEVEDALYAELLRQQFRESGPNAQKQPKFRNQERARELDSEISGLLGRAYDLRGDYAAPDRGGFDTIHRGQGATLPPSSGGTVAPGGVEAEIARQIAAAGVGARAFDPSNSAWARALLSGYEKESARIDQDEARLDERIVDYLKNTIEPQQAEDVARISNRGKGAVADSREPTSEQGYTDLENEHLEGAHRLDDKFHGLLRGRATAAIGERRGEADSRYYDTLANMTFQAQQAYESREQQNALRRFEIAQDARGDASNIQFNLNENERHPKRINRARASAIPAAERERLKEQHPRVLDEYDRAIDQVNDRAAQGYRSENYQVEQDEFFSQGRIDFANLVQLLLDPNTTSADVPGANPETFNQDRSGYLRAAEENLRVYDSLVGKTMANYNQDYYRDIDEVGRASGESVPVDYNFGGR